MSLSLSTLADQVGACTAVLMPLFQCLQAQIMAAERLHGDDTTVPVLARGKTDIARLWTYVRDDRPFGGPAPPGALRWSRFTGQVVKLGSPMKDGPDDGQAEAIFG